MRSIPKIIVMLVLFCVTLSYGQRQSSAQDVVYPDLKPDIARDILRDKGIGFTLIPDSQKSVGFQFEVAGTKASLFLEDQAYTFAVIWIDTLPLEVLNGWNSRYKFGKLISLPGGGTMLTYDVSTRGGITRNAVGESIDRFSVLIFSVLAYVAMTIPAP
jgi:hypothetical protein